MQRRFKILTASALVAGAVFVPGAVATGAGAQATPIQHVVVIFMENHSFDNVLGYWCDANPGRCPDGGMPSSVTLSNGAVVNPTVDPDTVPNITHNVAAQLAAMNIQGGVPQMNGWQNITGSQGTCAPSTKYKCISGYTPAQIPNMATLAQDFTVSDHTFSLNDSPSWGGHLGIAMASLDGFLGNNPQPVSGVTAGPGWGCDSNLVTPWQLPGSAGTVSAPSCIPDRQLDPVLYPNGGAFEPTPASYHSTIFDSIDNSNAGLTWRIYGAATPAIGTPNDSGYTWSICPSIAECLDTSQRTNLVDHTQFYTDASSGTLPSLSIVTAGGSNGGGLSSCHNGTSMTKCDNYIGSLVWAAENGPEWPSTAVFVTFDDFGGFYDQVPPGLNPDYTRQGMRVPLIIASPYAKPGFTDTGASTYAGILAYVEQNFGLPPLGPNDAAAYPFTNAFDYTQPPLRPAHMVTRPLPPTAPRHLTAGQAADPS